MKKYILRIFFIIIFVFTICDLKNVVYGVVIDNTESGNGGWSLLKMIYGRDVSVKEDLQNKIMEELNNRYVIDEEKKINSLEYTPIDIYTTVTMEKFDGNVNGRKVTIGKQLVGQQEQMIYYNNANQEITEVVTQNEGLFLPNSEESFRLDYSTVTEKLGYEGSEELFYTEDTISWDIKIEAELPNWESLTDGNGRVEYNIPVAKVYSGDDINNSENENKTETEFPDRTTEEAAPNSGEDDEISFWDFASHPKESAITLILDLIKVVFGDVPQMIANTAQIGFKNWKIMYKKNEIPFDLREYLDISNSIETKNQIKRTIKDKTSDGEEIQSYGFSSETEVPLIAVDIYTMVANKVDIVKANFLRKTGNELGAWILIRDFIVSIIHGVMYIVAAILIIVLIVDGIQIISRSFMSPQEKKEKIETMQKFAMGVAMLFGTLFIEAICIYSSEIILGTAGIEETKEGPLSVEVETAGYTFSTTPTGYVRYMADLKNLDLYQEKALYVVEYVCLAWSNLLILVSMTIRMLLMMFLSVIGFFLVLKNVLTPKKTDMVGYKSWIISYAAIASLQVILAIVARFILDSVTK